MALTDDELTDLKTARANYVTRLKEISESPKPNYNVEGQSFSWSEYQRMIVGQIKALDDLIEENDDSTDTGEAESLGIF